jgi:hypothetical protein
MIHDAFSKSPKDWLRGQSGNLVKKQIGVLIVLP